ncbi:MAG TPA: hypothetical protein VGP72_17150 [Planctomycetota bacterium]|jgi:hypothetical protein
MWVLLAAFCIFLFLLGGCTLLWWLARFLTLVLHPEHKSVAAAKASAAANAEIVQRLRWRLENDQAAGKLSPEICEQLRAYLDESEREAPQPGQAAGHAAGVSSAGQTVRPLAAVAAAPSAPPSLFARMAGRISHRLLDPEAVRALQSFGVIIVFAGVVAFVQSQVWTGASALLRTGLLIAAMSMCHVVGYVLCRWTTLRATGLIFLLAGELSLLYTSDASLSMGVWRISPLALWSVTAGLLSLAAYVYAQSLREWAFYPLALLAALACWGLCVSLCGVPLILLPASYVPVFLLTGVLEGKDAAHTQARWWLGALWRFGAPLLACGILVLFFRYARSAILDQYAWHATAILVLAAGLLTQASVLAHFLGAILILSAPALYAHAAGWSAAEWPAVLVVPGALLVVFEWLLEKRASSSVGQRLIALRESGAIAAVCGGALAVACRYGGASAPLLASLGALAVSVRCALGLGRAAYTWLMVGALALACVTACDRLLWDATHWPLLWLSVSMLAELARSQLRAREKLTAVAGVLAGRAVDALAVLSGCALVALMPALYSFDMGAAIQPQGILVAGWLALAAYPLLTSLTRHDSLRRAIGLSVLSPVFVTVLYGLGWKPDDVAMLVAGLAVLVCATDVAWRRVTNENATPTPLTVWLAPAVVGAHALFLLVHAASATPQRAAAGFALLAAAGVVVSCRLRAQQQSVRAAVAETIALLLLGASASAILPEFGFADGGPHKIVIVIALLLLAAGPLGNLCALLLRQDSSKEDHPFNGPRDWAGLLLSLLYLLLLLRWWLSRGEIPAAITAAWIGGLAPLFIALRHRTQLKRGVSALTVAWAGGVFLSGLFALLAIGAVAHAGFWTSTCPDDLRLSCAAFFGGVLLLSIVVGVWTRAALTPITGLVSTLVLIATACGRFGVPMQYFALCCVVLAWAGQRLVGILDRRGAEESGAMRMTRVISFLTASLGGFSALLLACGIFVWPTEPVQTAACISAGLLSLWYWPSREAVLSERRIRAQAFGACLLAALALCFALRGAGYGLTVLGPALATAGLALVLARGWVRKLDGEGAARRSGVTAATCAVALASFVCASLQKSEGVESYCAAVLLLTLLCWSLTVQFRQEQSVARGLWAGEAAGWMMLVFGASALTASRGWQQPVAWPLFGAGFVIVGKIAEAAARRFNKETLGAPPFLETRNFAAFSITALGLLAASFRIGSGDVLWPTLAGASALATYGSVSRWSMNDSVNKNAQWTCAMLAYAILAPLTWLILVHARAYPLLSFVALAPVLTVAARLVGAQPAHHAFALRWGARFVLLTTLVLACLRWCQLSAFVFCVVLLAVMFGDGAVATRCQWGEIGLS